MSNDLVDALLDTLAFMSSTCTRHVDGVDLVGKTCDSNLPYLFHATSATNLPAIRQDMALKPSEPPFGDGTVNFTANPHLHRFGSIRLVFDRRQLNVEPMCYTYGEEERKRSNLQDSLSREFQRRGETIAPNRIDNSIIGAEPWNVYKNECKHYTKEPVPLQGKVVGVEYWMPWMVAPLGGETVGSNVFPCHASWSAWSTGRAPEDNIAIVMAHIQEAKKLAEELGASFSVKSCYPFATLRWNEILPFDEENLKRMQRGERPRTETVYPIPDARCTCPDEAVPLELE